jgi:hypothetical protein
MYDGSRRTICIPLLMDSIISYVDSNKHYVMLWGMRRDIVKEQYKRGTQIKILSFLNMVLIILSMHAT